MAFTKRALRGEKNPQTQQTNCGRINKKLKSSKKLEESSALPSELMKSGKQKALPQTMCFPLLRWLLLGTQASLICDEHRLRTPLGCLTQRKARTSTRGNVGQSYIKMVTRHIPKKFKECLIFFTESTIESLPKEISNSRTSRVCSWYKAYYFAEKQSLLFAYKQGMRIYEVKEKFRELSIFKLRNQTISISEKILYGAFSLKVSSKNPDTTMQKEVWLYDWTIVNR